MGIGKISIIYDESKLSTVCERVDTLEEGERIAKELFKVLEKSGGIGLAPNQIGINKRVCVVNVNRPLTLINPAISGTHGSIRFYEGCLSFPNRWILTERYSSVAIDTMNWQDTKYFSANVNILECVCVQHEVDHVWGITMFLRKVDGDYGKKK